MTLVELTVFLAVAIVVAALFASIFLVIWRRGAAPTPDHVPIRLGVILLGAIGLTCIGGLFYLSNTPDLSKGSDQSSGTAQTPGEMGLLQAQAQQGVTESVVTSTNEVVKNASTDAATLGVSNQIVGLLGTIAGASVAGIAGLLVGPGRTEQPPSSDGEGAGGGGTSPPTSPTALLREWAKLRDEGIITDGDFNRMKERLLSEEEQKTFSTLVEPQKKAVTNGEDTTPPQVRSTNPQDKADDVPPDIHPTHTEEADAKLERFDPPGFLDDFNNEQRAKWSEIISHQFDAGVRGRPDEFDFDAPREQFYNPMQVETGPDAQSVDISWVGFPRSVEVTSVSDLQRWRKAETSRTLQDEYCEWSVERDADSGKITRVTFTCEGPEYWRFLAETTPEVVLDLYRQFVNPTVELGDLFLSNGRYNPLNRWNASTVEGAMHLIQQNNTLGAEIELVAGSSVVREIDGKVLTGDRELIECGKYGGVERHSDPHIGGQVHSLTRQKADVTLANPVGLYFDDLSTADWETPDGSDPKSFWTYVRGTEEKPVRAVYEVPSEQGFVVSDITIGGRPIVFGAQIADFVRIKLTGVATRFGQSTVAPMTGCRRDKALDAAASLASFAFGSALDLERAATR